MPITDAEKQTRYRQKEALKREADNYFKQLQFSFGSHKRPTTPQEIKSALDRAIELPSGWTDADLARAHQNLVHVFHDFFSMPDQLKNAVDEGTNSSQRFMATPDPSSFLKGEREALEKTRTLASHLISGLKLSACSEAEKAAALMEAVREVGRGISNQAEIPKSAATVMCLASLGPHYQRPKWFAKRLAIALKSQLDRELSNEVGKHLSDSRLGSDPNDRSLP